MTAAENEPTDYDTADKMVEFILAGGTFGNLAGFTQDELEAIYAVGHTFFSSQKYDKAISLFNFLCLYDHLQPRWFHSLGVAQQAKGEYANAAQSYATATLLDVSNPIPQAQAGYCLAALGMNEEAASALETAIIASGDKPQYERTRQQAEALLKTLKPSAGED